MTYILIGLSSIALGLWGLSVWWYSVMEVLRGLAPLLLIAFGLVAMMAGVKRNRRRQPADKDLLQTLEAPPPMSDDAEPLLTEDNSR
ncbi:MAG: hypothetical protein HQL48_07665 [Gammaproteobacteria bacterium]|nr:hypothetical protein [Gammaproteobacteria bacterium]